MKLLRKITLTLVALTFTGSAQAQTAPVSTQPDPRTTDAGSSLGRVRGEVAGVNAQHNQVTVKTAEGKLVTVMVDEKTLYRRVPPGETTLERAVAITLGDIGQGDSVLARGVLTADGEAIAARVLIVISRTDLNAKRARDRAEWLRRGIHGRVTAINAETKEMTVLVRGPQGSTPLVIKAAGGVRFLRYSPDSVRFRDAQTSTFAEVKLGDQLRALGDRSADGRLFTAEEVVSGSFRSTGGVIASVKPETKEVVVQDVRSQQPLTLVVNEDSMLRRLSPEVARLVEQRLAGGQPQPDAAARADGVDIQEMIEKLPGISLAELKPGEAVMVMGTAGSTPSRTTAIVLVTGVDSLIKGKGSQGMRDLNLVLGLPSGVTP